MTEGAAACPIDRPMSNTRLRRFDLGNSGDWKAVGDGVNELRIDFGPGYRVYFARRGNTILVLLAGARRRPTFVAPRASGGTSKRTRAGIL